MILVWKQVKHGHLSFLQLIEIYWPLSVDSTRFSRLWPATSGQCCGESRSLGYYYYYWLCGVLFKIDRFVVVLTLSCQLFGILIIVVVLIEPTTTTTLAWTSWIAQIEGASTTTIQVSEWNSKWSLRWERMTTTTTTINLLTCKTLKSHVQLRWWDLSSNSAPIKLRWAPQAKCMQFQLCLCVIGTTPQQQQQQGIVQQHFN